MQTARRLDGSNLLSQQEMTVVEFLRTRRIAEPEQTSRDITEIAVETGIGDTDEVLRSLYSLEGKSLVQPEPEGDFTSSFWRISDVGLKALSMLDE